MLAWIVVLRGGESRSDTVGRRLLGRGRRERERKQPSASNLADTSLHQQVWVCADGIRRAEGEHGQEQEGEEGAKPKGRDGEGTAGSRWCVNCAAHSRLPAVPKARRCWACW